MEIVLKSEANDCEGSVSRFNAIVTAAAHNSPEEKDFCCSELHWLQNVAETNFARFATPPPLFSTPPSFHFSQHFSALTFFNGFPALPLFFQRLFSSPTFSRDSPALPNFLQVQFSAALLLCAACDFLLLSAHRTWEKVGDFLFTIFFRLHFGQPWCKMRQHGSKVNISYQFLLSNISQCWKILSGCFFQIKLLVKVFQVFQVWCCFPTFRLLLFQAGIGGKGRWTSVPSRHFNFSNQAQLLLSFIPVHHQCRMM